MIEKLFGWGYLLAFNEKEDTIIFKEEDFLRQIGKNHTLGYQIIGNGIIEIKALNKLKLLNKEILLKKSKSKCLAQVQNESSFEIIETQLKTAYDQKSRLYFAKKFVYSGIQNKLTIINLFKKKLPEKEVNKTINRIKNIITSFADFKKINSLNVLRGIEGETTHHYFSLFTKVFKDSFEFEKRTKFPPKDPLNAALSFLYVQLSTLCTDVILSIGLSPKIGFLHESSKKRDSLALDLAEEFRQPIVDKIIFSLAFDSILNSKTHFSHMKDRVLLNKKGRKIVSKFFSSEIKKFYKIIVAQAHALKQAIISGIKYDPFILKQEMI